MAIKMQTRGLMAGIALLGGLMSIPFQCRTSQEELYRLRAVRHDELAAERRARSRGDVAAAEQHRLRAERIERQGWIYRKASYHRWQWPEFRTGRRSYRSPY